MRTQNNLIFATMAAGVLVLCLIAGALYDPLDLRTVWNAARAAKNPMNDEAALYNNAFRHFKANDDLLAQDVTNRLLKVSPRSARGHKLRAALHLRGENFAAALNESRIAAQLDPADPLAQLAIAESLKGLGDKEGATKAFEQVSENPLSPTVLRDKAETLAEQIAKPKLADTTAAPVKFVNQNKTP